MRHVLDLSVPTLVAALLLGGCQSAPGPVADEAPRQAPAAQFGVPERAPDAVKVSAAEVFAAPEAFDGRPVELTGTVASVCAKRGCWLRLGDEGSDQTVFVKFTCPISGRLIPEDAVGKRATVVGTLERGQMPESAARHYAEDAGQSPEAIASIRGPQTVLRVKSPGAWIDGVSSPAAEQ